MNYFNSAADSIKGAADSIKGTVPDAGVSSWSNMFSSNPVPNKDEELDTPAPGSATQVGPPTGGRRKKQCGGSFHPYTEDSNSASTASIFKGGRRNKSRKVHRKVHRKSHNKKSRRKSHTKRR